MTDKVAVVTGSTRGIGLAIAQALHADGVQVVLNGRSTLDVERAVSAFEDNQNVHGIACDVGNADDAERLIGGAVAKFGRLDLLVNNAALADPVSHFLDLEPALWHDVIRTNLGGVFLCSRFAARQFVATGSPGVIINISSFGAKRAHRSLAAYDAAKGGVDALTRAMALDLAPFGIRVNGVAPGPIRTPGAGDSLEATARRAAVVPLGRIGLPADVAGAVMFLAGDGAEFITGQCVVVDGGVSAQLRPPSLDTPVPERWRRGDERDIQQKGTE
jgi:NAD(P)-dependent dehydrogenase (short-subunit alcohol dehydrogenase family)